MKTVWKQILSLLLVIALTAVLIPDAVFAEETAQEEDESTEAEAEAEAEAEEEDEAEGAEQVISSSITVDEDGNVVEDEEEAADVTAASSAESASVAALADTASSESTSSSDTASDTAEPSYTYTYTLKITVTANAASSKDDTVRKFKVSKAKLTTTKTDTSTGTSTSSTSTYDLTVKCSVKGDGWQKASLNSEKTAYSFDAGTGKRIQAVIINPSDALKTAMKNAGITFYYRTTSEYFGTLGWARYGYKSGSVGCGCNMTGFELEVMTTAEAESLSTDYRYIRPTSVNYKTRATGATSWYSLVKNGTVSGKKSASSSLGSLKAKLTKSDTTFSVSGSISYRVRTNISNSSKYWSDWKSGLSTAGSKNSSIQAIQIKLNGDLADYYDVYYRVYVGNYGWLGWTKNGSKAGTQGIGLSIGAVQIKLVPKGSGAPGSTSQSYVNSISGDDTLDGYLTKIYKKKGTNLYTLFKYVAHFTYYRTYDTPSGSWKKWTITYAKEFWENQGGNCYRYAALFCWLAIGLGYNAKVQTGYVPSRSRGWAPHGWTMIKKSGTWYVCDPDLYKSYPTRRWYMVTYKNASTTYKKK